MDLSTETKESIVEFDSRIGRKAAEGKGFDARLH
jgi:hypothetical protein